MDRGVDRRLVGFDPTNDQETGAGHIWVGMAHDGDDVYPLTGSHLGGTTSDLEESFDITRLA